MSSLGAEESFRKMVFWESCSLFPNIIRYHQMKLSPYYIHTAPCTSWVFFFFFFLTPEEKTEKKWCWVWFGPAWHHFSLNNPGFGQIYATLLCGYPVHAMGPDDIFVVRRMTIWMEWTFGGGAIILRKGQAETKTYIETRRPTSYREEGKHLFLWIWTSIRISNDVWRDRNMSGDEDKLSLVMWG